MAFCGQMHDRIGVVCGKHHVQRGAVTNIDLFKRIIRVIRDACDIVQTRGIGQRINIDHAMPARNGQTDHGRSDEPCAACDQNLHEFSP